MNSQSLYSIAARWYDIVILRLFGYERAAEYIVQQLPFAISDRIDVLDAGAGTGLYTFAILKRFPYATITAFDLNDAMLAKLGRKAEEKGVADRITRFRGSILEPIPGKKQYDLIMTGGVLEYVDLKQAVDNLSSDLKSGGYWLNAGVKNTVVGKLLGGIAGFRPYAKDHVVTTFTESGLSLNKYLNPPTKFFFMRLVKEAYIFNKL